MYNFNCEINTCLIINAILNKWVLKFGRLIPVIILFISPVVCSQELSTVSEVYDFDIGDEFHSYEYHGNYLWTDGLERYYNIEITNKLYSPGDDTLFYVQKVFIMSRWYYGPWDYDNYTQTIILRNLDSTISHSEVSMDSAHSVEHRYNGRTVNYGSNEFPSINVEYVDGCGLASYEKIIDDISYTHISEYRLRYFKKGDETWGDPVYARMESKVGDVYDFDIGDIFHYKDSTYLLESHFPTCVYYNVKITNKYYSYDQDTLFYVRDVKSTSGEEYQDTIQFTELDSFIHVDTNHVDSIFSDEDFYLERKTNQIQYDLNLKQSGISLKYWYTEGCGLTFYHKEIFEGDKNYYSLIYYKKGEEEWGDPFYVGIIENVQEPNRLSVYPNPTSSLISIALPTQPPKNTSLTLYNTNGQQLITQLISVPKTEIDISHLANGIYIIKVWNDKDVMVQKVIKQ